MILIEDSKYMTTVAILLSMIGIAFSEFLSFFWFEASFLPRSVMALGDIPFNISASCLAIAPFAFLCKSPFSFCISWAALLSMLLDIDHFIAAGSLSLKAAITLPHRPASHSFIVIFLFCICLSFITKSREIGILSFFSLCAHLLRDAPSAKNLLYYPLSQNFYNIPSGIALILLVLLPLITVLYANFLMKISALHFWFTDMEGTVWFNRAKELMASPLNLCLKGVIQWMLKVANLN